MQGCQDQEITMIKLYSMLMHWGRISLIARKSMFKIIALDRKR